MNRVLVMSFDGETQLENKTFYGIDAAWEYADDLDSKWFFYPFVFVVSESGKTIKDAPSMLKNIIGKRVKTIQKKV